MTKVSSLSRTRTSLQTFHQIVNCMNGSKVNVAITLQYTLQQYLGAPILDQGMGSGGRERVVSKKHVCAVTISTDSCLIVNKNSQLRTKSKKTQTNRLFLLACTYSLSLSLSYTKLKTEAAYTLGWGWGDVLIRVIPRQPL